MALVRGTEGDDTLRGTADGDTVLGLGGFDTLYGKAGADTLRGGADWDVLRGELGDDQLYGDSGTDTLYGGVGNDRVFGGADGDNLEDGANGPDGNDVYDGGGGANDWVWFFNQDVGVNLTLAEGGADSRAVQGGEVDVVRNVEFVAGSGGDDVIFGNSADNSLDGGPGRAGGNDRLYGRGGDDFMAGGADPTASLLLDGGSGADTLIGTIGHMRLFGGTGADFLSAGFELSGQASDVDRNDLGADTAADTFSANIGVSDDGTFGSGFGIESVTNARPQDRFDIELVLPGADNLNAGDFLDSDANGVVNDADRDARLVGSDLLLDLDQLFERVDSSSLDYDVQHVILEQMASINADQFI